MECLTFAVSGRLCAEHDGNTIVLLFMVLLDYGVDRIHPLNFGHWL